MNNERKNKLQLSTNNSKGITLVALIITIIVLLILAVVAIRAVTGDGIIAHAKNAQTQYEEAQDEENDILSYYQEYLDVKGDLGPWKQDGNKIYMQNSEGKLTELEIGDVVNYNATAGVTDNNLLTYTSSEAVTGATNQKFTATEGTWGVLGIEHGRILLVSTHDIKTDNNDYYKMSGQRLYFIGIEELNNICSIYGYGAGAQSARSIRVEDINKITGFDPNVYEGGRDKINEYGNTIVFTANEENIKYKAENGEEGTVTYDNVANSKRLYYIEDGIWKDSLETGTSKSFKVDGYTYAASLDSESASKANINMRMLSNSKAYKMLFKNDNNENPGRYILASKTVLYMTDYNYAIYYGMRIVSKGVVSYYAGSYGTEVMDKGFAIRPVITLKPDVQLVDENGDGKWEIK